MKGWRNCEKEENNIIVLERLKEQELEGTINLIKFSKDFEEDSYLNKF